MAWPTTTVDRTGPDRTGLDRTRICSGGGCGLVLGRGRRAFRRAPANEHRTGTLSSDFQLQHFISHRCHESSPSRSDEDSSGARTPPMPTHIARYEVSSCRSPFCTAITSVHSLVPVVPHLPLVPTSTKPTRPQPSAAAVGRRRRPPPSAAPTAAVDGRRLLPPFSSASCPVVASSLIQSLAEQTARPTPSQCTVRACRWNRCCAVVDAITGEYVQILSAIVVLIQKNRAMAATAMNPESSRSHSIFMMTISRRNLKDLSNITGE